MQKQEIINQVRLVYDFAYGVSKAAANKCLNKVDRQDLDRVIGGLWLIIKDTLGESFRIEPDGEDVPSPSSGCTGPTDEIRDDQVVPDNGSCAL